MCEQLASWAAFMRNSRPAFVVASDRNTDSPHVAILLAVRNGARFLSEQLQSYAEQTHPNWSVHVSDDGSSDGTHDIIQDFAGGVPQEVTLRCGPRTGAAANFLSLLCDGKIEADYFAFSDQDDIWYAEKLGRAINMLRTVPRDQPALYCSRTELIDEAGRHLGYSTAFKRPPSFRNALVQNVGGGNTMVFNRLAGDLLRHVPDEIVVAHDWMTYLTVSAAGGMIFYDQTPSVRYRQHRDNLVGSNLGFQAAVHRAKKILAGQWRGWNSLNVTALMHHLSHRMTEENMSVLERFVEMRLAESLPRRLWNLWRSGVYRQTPLANLAMLLAVIANKV
ncbi:glycosyltransferase family 2 protein [Bradyrhizobium sp. CCGUVB23]|uniref:glycosyltransferase family 2 protein n=1 Tax=Bradyrhizobium sp. CCGUVB23 TaxID=2949630 RepID=UPI0020B24C61|nr:glycosyltransferase family 2 protein [Bradyrhizobium sp. CCGUVB23]MCP3460933.1 glycosyltransferase family 2 protein [Bradyrhizobium sp. CCGUVB23]